MNALWKRRKSSRRSDLEGVLVKRIDKIYGKKQGTAREVNFASKRGESDAHPFIKSRTKHEYRKRRLKPLGV